MSSMNIFRVRCAFRREIFGLHLLYLDELDDGLDLCRRLSAGHA
jgi:hypothetical protein